MSYGIISISCHLEFRGYCSINATHWTAGSGIYCVFSNRAEYQNFPVYIGKAECISRRIGAHRSDDEEMKVWDPDSKGLYICYAMTKNEEDLFYIEPAMIFRLQPKHNKQHKNAFPYTRPETRIVMSGQNQLLDGEFEVYPGQRREHLQPHDWRDHTTSEQF